MNIRNALITALLFCIGGLAVNGQSPQIQVEIKLPKTTVKNHEGFIVLTALRNISNVEKQVRVWSCSYPNQWGADNPYIYVPYDSDCMKNAFGLVKLKPGESYKRNLPVRVVLASGDSTPKSVTFRLGYVNERQWALSTNGSPPIWSNAVTVSVTR
jgi:hypothetical protein